MIAKGSAPKWSQVLDQLGEMLLPREYEEGRQASSDSQQLIYSSNRSGNASDIAYLISCNIQPHTPVLYSQ